MNAPISIELYNTYQSHTISGPCIDTSVSEQCIFHGISNEKRGFAISITN
jgi:hypothetical protein